MDVSLEVISGPEDGRMFNLDVLPCIIGRDERVDFQIATDKYISRRHARLFVEDNQFYVEDLGSTNGTFVNKVRLLTRVPLSTRQTFQVGKTMIELDIKKT